MQDKIFDVVEEPAETAPVVGPDETKYAKEPIIDCEEPKEIIAFPKGIAENSLVEPDYNDLDRKGLLKVCTPCSDQAGKPVFMSTIEATAAEVYDDPTKDNIDVRTWGVCKSCKRIIQIA